MNNTHPSDKILALATEALNNAHFKRPVTDEQERALRIADAWDKRTQATGGTQYVGGWDL